MQKCTVGISPDRDPFWHMFENHGAVMLVISPGTGAIVRANRSAELFYGYPPGTLATMHVGELNTLPHPDIVAAMEVAIRERFSRFEFSHRLASGELRLVEVYSSRIDLNDGAFLFSIIHDITDRKRAEDALRASEQKFRHIANTTIDSYWELDRFGKIVEANDECCLMYGYPREELLGKTIHDFEANENDEETRAHTGRIMRDLYDRFETLHRCKDGRVLDVEVSTTFVPESERFLAFVRDVTARKKVDERLSNLNAELEQRVALRTEELLETNRNMESFSYSVSHDLRAPLRAVDGYARILVEELGPTLSAEHRRYLDKLSQNVRNMGVLIDDLLSFARMSRHIIEKQRVSPALLVYEALAVLERERKDRQLDIRVGELPPCHADPTLLRQVYVNLLSNAFKFSRDRAPARIEIGSVVMNDGPAYFVRDNGVGFDMSFADKLFGVFQRLHGSSDFEGTGVGLAIVQKIIQRHGGRVWAEAAMGEGATFYFTLAT